VTQVQDADRPDDDAAALPDDMKIIKAAYDVLTRYGNTHGWQREYVDRAHHALGLLLATWAANESILPRCGAIVERSAGAPWQCPALTDHVDPRTFRPLCGQHGGRKPAAIEPRRLKLPYVDE
jgi:hypothetical protein